MTKAILLMDAEGASRSPAILCAENAEESHAKALPLFSTVFAQLTAGIEVRPSATGFDLFENGTYIGTLEVFTPGQTD